MTSSNDAGTASRGSYEMSVSCWVNGKPCTVSVPARLLLVDLLRDHLGLTGTKVGCEHGVCGSCTIHLDGEAVRSCLMLAVQADGRTVVTIEGLQDNPRWRSLQESLVEHHGLQCGFCTPGIAMSLTAQEAQHLQSDDVRSALAGNVCRCTGYQQLADAVSAWWTNAQ